MSEQLRTQIRAALFRLDEDALYELAALSANQIDPAKSFMIEMFKTAGQTAVLNWLAQALQQAAEKHGTDARTTLQNLANKLGSVEQAQPVIKTMLP